MGSKLEPQDFLEIINGLDGDESGIQAIADAQDRKTAWFFVKQAEEAAGVCGSALGGQAILQMVDIWTSLLWGLDIMPWPEPQEAGWSS